MILARYAVFAPLLLWLAGCTQDPPPPPTVVAPAPAAPEAAVPAPAAPEPAAPAAPEAAEDCTKTGCPSGQTCTSPERQRWNDCGMPRGSSCGPHQVGDACGHCFRSCAADDPCPSGQVCGASYCESPPSCRSARPMPP